MQQVEQWLFPHKGRKHSRFLAILTLYEDIPEWEFQLDPEKYQAHINGKLLSLTVVEFHPLAILAEHPGRVFSRNQLIERIYPDQRVGSDRTIDSHIKKLIKKNQRRPRPRADSLDLQCRI